MGYETEMNEKEKERYQEIILEKLRNSKTGREDWRDLVVDAQISYEEKFGQQRTNPNKVFMVLDSLVERGTIIRKKDYAGVKHYSLPRSKKSTSEECADTTRC